MQSSFEKLKKFFRLEAEKNYNDQAIIGGLAKVLDFWEGEARASGIDEETVQAVSTCLRGYHDLAPEARAESLKSLWGRVQAQRPGLGDIPPAPARPAVMETGRAKPSQPQQRRPQPEAGRSASVPGAGTRQRPIALNASLTVLAGVGPRHAQTLEKLDLKTLGDMLYFFPRRYDDYSQLKPIHRLFYGESVTVVGTLQTVANRPVRGGASSITEAVINDGTGALRLTWFNQPWVANRLAVGEAISVSGKIDQYLGRLVMNSPDWESIEAENLHTNRIVPIYSLTATITQKWLRKIVHQVVSYWAPKLTDHLPASIREAAQLPTLGEALLQVHHPDSQESLRQARQRLAFDEIFFLQMGVLRQKREWQAGTARFYEVPDDELAERARLLPYTLTNAQQRALQEIRADLRSGRPMNRACCKAMSVPARRLSPPWAHGSPSRPGPRLPSWPRPPSWPSSITATCLRCWWRPARCRPGPCGCWWATPRKPKKTGSAPDSPPAR